MSREIYVFFLLEVPVALPRLHLRLKKRSPREAHASQLLSFLVQATVWFSSLCFSADFVFASKMNHAQLALGAAQSQPGSAQSPPDLALTVQHSESMETGIALLEVRLISVLTEFGVSQQIIGALGISRCERGARGGLGQSIAATPEGQDRNVRCAMGIAIMAIIATPATITINNISRHQPWT